MSAKFNPGDTIELKDKEISFYDSETGFDISRSQQVKLGDSIGARTNAALMSGGLLVVSGEKKSSTKNTEDDSKTAKKPESDLPKDFPGRDVLVKLGVSFEQVKAMTPEKRLGLNGIGDKTNKEIDVYLKK